MPLVRPRPHHRRINELFFQVLEVGGSEIARHSGLFHVVPLRELFRPAGRFVRLNDADVLAERRRWKALGVVLVRQAVVVVNVVKTTTFDCVYVPWSCFQPTPPRPADLLTHAPVVFQRVSAIFLLPVWPQWTKYCKIMRHWGTDGQTGSRDMANTRYFDFLTPTSYSAPNT